VIVDIPKGGVEGEVAVEAEGGVGEDEEEEEDARQETKMLQM